MTKILTAREARRASNIVAANNARKAAAEKAKRSAAAKKGVIDGKRRFIRDFSNDLNEVINYAIEDGDKSATYCISSNHNDFDRAQATWDKHRYLPQMKLVIRRFKKLGYKIEFKVKETRHTTQHESMVPDYDYSLYHAELEITWK